MRRFSLFLGSVLAISSFVVTGCGGGEQDETETTSARTDDTQDTSSSSKSSATTSTGGDGSSTTAETTAETTSDASSSTNETSSEQTSSSSEETTTTEEMAQIDCDMLTHEGNAVGQVPNKLALRDFEGNPIELHTLCNKPVLILSGSASSEAFIADAKAADALLEEHYSAGELKVVYMFSALQGEHGISITDYLTEVASWGTGENAGIGDHGLAINDYTRDALKHYFGTDVPDNESRRVMLLKPGFEVAQVLDRGQIDSREFKVKLDALIAGNDIPEDPTPLNCDALLHETRADTSLKFGVDAVVSKNPMTDIAGNDVNLFEMCNQTLVVLTGSESNSDFIDDAVAVDLLMEGTYTSGNVKAVYIFSPTQAEIDNSATTALPTNAELTTLSDAWNTNAVGSTGHVFNDADRSDLKFYFGSGILDTETRRVMVVKPGFKVHTTYDTDVLIDAIDFRAVIDAAIATNNR